MAATVPKLASLYRSIRRAHKYLPSEMKELGDRYVRHEFRQMMESKSTSTDQIKAFDTEWQTYLNTIIPAQQEKEIDLGEDLDYSLLNDDQKQRLEQLRRETDSK